jgi:hypothetical protein
MITVHQDAVPTRTQTAAGLGTAALTMVGLTMWPVTMIGRLEPRGVLRCGVARVVAVGLRTMVGRLARRRMRWVAMIGQAAAVLRGMAGQRSTMIGRAALAAQRVTERLRSTMIVQAAV